MDIKYFFKNLYIRKKILILLLFQSIIYIYFLMNLTSMAMLESNFTRKYSENFPLKNGAYIDSGMDSQKLQNQIDKVKDFLNYIESNKDIKSYRLTVFDRLNAKEFNINTDNFKQEHSLNPHLKEDITVIRINYNYYSEFKKKVSGDGFEEKDFDKDTEFTPVILGEIYKKDYKLGDIISNNDKSSNFKVVGFLKKNILFTNGSNPAISTLSSEKSFIVPLTKTFLSKDAFMLPHAMRNMVFTFNDDADNSKVIKDISDKGSQLGIDLLIKDFYGSLNEFLENLQTNIQFEAIKTLIYTLLSFGIFTLSFIYLINNRKREIGVLYALGASKRNIIFMISLDMIFIICLAYLISAPIYICFGENLIYMFINDFNIINLGLPFIIMLLVSLLSLVIPIRGIVKLNPNELIRGK